MKDPDEQTQANAQEHLDVLIKEEAHYTRLANVFGSSEGIEILEWLLEICGYWTASIENERRMGKFEIGRHLLNQLCIADIELVHVILSRRGQVARAEMDAEKKRVSDTLKTN